MSAAERVSETSSAEPANECAVRANEQTDERVAQYSMRLFLNHWADLGLDGGPELAVHRHDGQRVGSLRLVVEDRRRRYFAY